MRTQGLPTIATFRNGPTGGSAPARPRSGAPPVRPQPRTPLERLRLPGLLLGLLLGAGVTALVIGLPSLRYGPQRPALHAQIATASALVALLVALLAAGRHRRGALAADLLLALAFGVLGVVNLVTSAVQGATGASPHGPLAWTPVSGRLVAAALLAAAAVVRGRAPGLARPRPTARLLAFASAGALAALALGLAALDPQLPRALGDGVPASGAPFGPFSGSPASVVLKAACLVLVVAAAAGFAGRSRRTPDRLAVPLAWGTVLLAFAWLNYLLVPSLYVNWFYAGDVLALAAYVVLAGGAVAEIREVQRDRARLATLAERGRVARELHDGVAQEVLYLLAQARRLRADRPGPEADRLLVAAERALDESRAAISALRAPPDEPPAAALARIGRELGRRLELDVRVEVEPGVELEPAARDALSRIVGEALANAARHGRARHATVELRGGPPRRLVVRDDGDGFDPDPARVPAGSFGLASIRERAAAIGGEARIRSAPGAGAEVEVTLP